MHVSMTELKAALKRYFEASGYCVGNDEDAANMILWLESHGLDGLAELSCALPYIFQDQYLPLSTLSDEDEATAIINCYGRSALNSIQFAMDLGYAKAAEFGMSTIRIHQCHNRKFVLKALTDNGRDGMSTLAFWQNGQAQITEHLAYIQSNDHYPYYQMICSNRVHQEMMKQSLMLICSASSHLMRSTFQSFELNQMASMTAKEMAANKAKSIEQGIEIKPSLWQEILAVGDGVLVENSAQSRLGAGAAY